MVLVLFAIPVPCKIYYYLTYSPRNPLVVPCDVELMQGLPGAHTTRLESQSSREPTGHCPT